MPGQLVVVVHGIPAPQGSKIRNPNGGVREASKRVGPWREAVRHTAAAVAADKGWVPKLSPNGAPAAVIVAATFTLSRPRSHYRTGRNAGTLRDDAPTRPTGRPDLDKLIRSTLDGLTDSGVIADDANVAEVWAVKTYPAGDMDALDTPGAVIVVRGLS